MGEAPSVDNRAPLAFGQRLAATETDVAAVLREGGPDILADRLSEVVIWAQGGPRAEAVREASTHAYTLTQVAATALIATALADDGRIVLRGLNLADPMGLAQVAYQPGLLEDLFPGEALAILGRAAGRPELATLADRWRDLLEEAIAALPEEIGRQRNEVTKAALLFTWRLALDPTQQDALRTEFLTVAERHPDLMEIPWVADLADRPTSTPARAIALIAAVESSGAKLIRRLASAEVAEDVPSGALTAQRWLGTLIMLGIGVMFTIVWALWGQLLYEILPGLDPRWWWLYPACQFAATLVLASVTAVFAAHPRFSPGAVASLHALALCGGILASGDLRLGTLLVSAEASPSLFYSFLGAAVAPFLGCLLALLYGVVITATPLEPDEDPTQMARRRTWLWFATALPGVALGVGWATILLRTQLVTPDWPSVLLTASTMFAWWVFPTFTVCWLVLGQTQFRCLVPTLIGVVAVVLGLFYPTMARNQMLQSWTASWLCPETTGCAAWQLLTTAMLPPWWPAGVLVTLYALAVAIMRPRRERTP
ncbi:MAG: hypothetical protein Q4D79_05060 [Propionibacteriaceae bacterium]|nr:hypothetical protein [Propionibacteriaceae bacterium]